MEKDLAISVSNLYKSFSIPHEKITTIRGAFINIFKTNSYEVFEALDDVTFSVKKGEFFGILGRNGSGKSTLLKILAGVYGPEAGKIKINGLVSPFLELGIGFQDELSGRDNVYLNATVLGLTKRQINKKFDDIVEFSEIGRFIDQKIKNYSSGMSVRLAFSVAIHANRDILLMDEVLAVGDVNFQAKCLREFSRYRDEGKTVILVTHDIATVQRYCDRAMLVRNGKIVIIGDPHEVGDKYVAQNIEDEKIRISAEKKEKRSKQIQKSAEEKDDKIAKITDVEFLDSNGNAKTVFETGEDMAIRIYFEKNRDIGTVNFGLGIYNQEGDYIFGVDTQNDKIDVKKFLELGYFEIAYDRLPLRTNSYYVKAGIWGHSPQDNYAFLDKSKYFTVFSKDDRKGIINLDYRWK